MSNISPQEDEFTSSVQEGQTPRAARQS
jgi:hypothetical protein